MTTIYGSSAGFTEYHEQRNNEVSAAIENDEINAALLVASEYIDARYVASFDGLKTGGRDQIREWPRTGHVDRYGNVIASNIIPREIDHSTYEIALKHLKNPTLLNADYTPSKYKQVSVDGAVSATYNNFDSVADVQTQFKKVNEIMSALFSNNSTSSSKLSGSSYR